MCTPKQPFYFWFLAFLIVQYKRSSAIQVYTGSIFFNLLRNLRNCDVQIVHSGERDGKFSLNGLNMGITSIFAPEYESFEISSMRWMGKELPAMNIFKLLVENFTPLKELWCTSESWMKKNLTVANNEITRIKTVNELMFGMFSNGNITLMFKHSKRATCNSYRNVVQFKGTKPIYSKDVELIITESEGYKFLTCYTEPYISFYFYFTPFQTELWVTLGVSIAIIIALRP